LAERGQIVDKGQAEKRQIVVAQKGQIVDKKLAEK
jgi:hypothetical protein